MIYTYFRVSTLDQSLQSQKTIVNDYLVSNKLVVDESVEAFISSKKSPDERKIIELIDKLDANSTLIVSEISRLGRSLTETIGLVEKIKEKKATFIAIKNGLRIDTVSNDVATKVMLTVFSLIDDLSRTYISDRTKAGLKAIKDNGGKLGKPIGTIQKSIYDKDKERIFELFNLGVSVNKIVDIHLKYGKPQSLTKFIKKIGKVVNKKQP